jgi:hypothetical protein
VRTATEALAWAEQQTTWPAAQCENAVWNAFGAPVAIPRGGYPDANAGWLNTLDKHTTLAGIRPGALVYFTGTYGHVALYKGNGILRSTYTDAKGVGRYGDIAIDTILSPSGWGRRLLGWGGDAFGHPIDFTGVAGERSIRTTASKEENDMPILELVIDDNGSGVWFCVNRIERRHVADQQQQADYLFFMQTHGYPDAKLVKVGRIDSYGVIVK